MGFGESGSRFASDVTGTSEADDLGEGTNSSETAKLTLQHSGWASAPEARFVWSLSRRLVMKPRNGFEAQEASLGAHLGAPPLSLLLLLCQAAASDGRLA